MSSIISLNQLGWQPFFQQQLSLEEFEQTMIARVVGEPGCAVQAALDSGGLDPRRLANYLKLLAEQARNSASLQVLRTKDKQFGKMVKSVSAESRLFKKGY